MTPKEVLIAAKTRFFIAECRDLGESLRTGAEYPVYCRALFLLKRAMGCDPRQSLFEWQESFAHVSLDTIRTGFNRAIQLAAQHE